MHRRQTLTIIDDFYRLGALTTVKQGGGRYHGPSAQANPTHPIALDAGFCASRCGGCKDCARRSHTPVHARCPRNRSALLPFLVMQPKPSPKRLVMQ